MRRRLSIHPVLTQLEGRVALSGVPHVVSLAPTTPVQIGSNEPGSEHLVLNASAHSLRSHQVKAPSHRLHEAPVQAHPILHQPHPHPVGSHPAHHPVGRHNPPTPSGPSQPTGPAGTIFGTFSGFISSAEESFSGTLSGELSNGFLSASFTVSTSDGMTAFGTVDATVQPGQFLSGNISGSTSSGDVFFASLDGNLSGDFLTVSVIGSTSSGGIISGSFIDAIPAGALTGTFSNGTSWAATVITTGSVL